MQPAKINYKVYQGSTFQEVFRWESETKVYLKISNILKSAPCIIQTQETPELPLGWRFQVVGVGGMKEINTYDGTGYIVTAINKTDKTLEINQVNSVVYSAYTSGGVVEYNAPVDLTNYSARMQIRETVDSPDIIYYGTNDSDDIVIDNTLKTITITIPAQITENFTFTTAVYSVELFTPSGRVIPFLTGNMTLVQEVVR